MQQMAQMCQQMNMATNKPPPLMHQMQFQPQQFQQQQQGWAKPKRAKKTSGYVQAATSMGNSFGGYENNNAGDQQANSQDQNRHVKSNENFNYC